MTVPPPGQRRPPLRPVPSEAPTTRPSAEFQAPDPRDLEIAHLRRLADERQLELLAKAPADVAPESLRTGQGRRLAAIVVPLLTALVGGAGGTIAAQRPEPPDRVAAVYQALAEAARQASSDQARRAAATDARIEWLMSETDRLQDRVRELERAARRDRRAVTLGTSPESSEPPPAPAPPRPVRLPETAAELAPAP